MIWKQPPEELKPKAVKCSCLRGRDWGREKGFAFHRRPSALFHFVIVGEDIFDFRK